MNLGRTTTTLAAAAIATLTSLSAEAAIISIPTGNVTASTQIGGTFDRQDDYLVDGSGLTGGLHTTAVEPNMWLSEATGLSAPVHYEQDAKLLAGLNITIGAWVLQLNVRDELRGFLEFAHVEG